MATTTVPFGEQPAFPCGAAVESYDTGEAKRLASGVTIRDWFAAQALIGFLAYNPGPADEKIHQASAYVAATAAYEFADAMLKARERKSE